MEAIFLTAVALFVVATLLEGWDFSGLRGNLATCITDNKTLCLAVFTAVAAARPGWAGVGLLMLFGIRSLYLVVLGYGLLIWCRSRIAKNIRRFCRTIVALVQWIQKKLRVVRYFLDVVTSTLTFLGALAALQSALALTTAPSAGALTALRAWKDFLVAVFRLFKSLWRWALRYLPLRT